MMSVPPRTCALRAPRPFMRSGLLRRSIYYCSLISHCRSSGPIPNPRVANENSPCVSTHYHLSCPCIHHREHIGTFAGSRGGKIGHNDSDTEKSTTLQFLCHSRSCQNGFIHNICSTAVYVPQEANRVWIVYPAGLPHAAIHDNWAKGDGAPSSRVYTYICSHTDRDPTYNICLRCSAVR